MSLFNTRANTCAITTTSENPIGADLYMVVNAGGEGSQKQITNDEQTYRRVEHSFVIGFCRI